MRTAAVLEPGVVPILMEEVESTRYEIVNGQRMEKPPMSAYATWIAFQIAHYIQLFAAAHKLGRAGTEHLFLLDPAANLQRRPDADYVSFERWPEAQFPPHTDPWPVVPEIAIEVVCKSNPADTIVDKVADYFQTGVKLVWIVFPRRHQVYVYESPTQVRILTAADELDGGNVLPGFRLSLATLFGPVPSPADPGDTSTSAKSSPAS